MYLLDKSNFEFNLVVNLLNYIRNYLVLYSYRCKSNMNIIGVRINFLIGS